MEFLFSVIVVCLAVYCAHTGHPVTWLRKNGYTKYRIIHTTKYSPKGVYILQESCIGLIWHKSIFDVTYWDECSVWYDGTETVNIEEIRAYKQWIETKTLNLKEERKRKKITKVIE
jgi:hypothetical protein